MRKKIFTLFVLLLALLSCNNNKFSNPTDYMKYAGTVSSGGSSSDNAKRFTYYILTVAIEGDGSVLFNDGKYNKELKLLKDTKVRLEAMEDTTSREKFQGWSGTINSANKVIPSLLIDKNITILATFGIPKVEKKLMLDIRKGGTVYIDDGSGEVEYKNTTDETIRITKTYNLIEEETVTLKLRAEPNEPVIDWNGWDGLGPNNIKDKEIEVVLNSSMLISASFGTTRYLSIQNDTALGNVGYIEYSINNGSFVTYTREVEIDLHSIVRIRAVPHNVRTHEFLNWSSGSAQSSLETLDVVSDITLTAYWKEIKRTLTINKGAGNVNAFRVNGATHNYTGTPITVSILRDSQVTIEAVERYYPITSWTGVDKVTATPNIATIKLEEDVSVVANFGTGAFDVYNNSGLHYEASKFDTWVLAATQFDNKEVPTYVFYNNYSWPSSSTPIILNGTTLNEFKYRGANSKVNVGGLPSINTSEMDYYMYKGQNYYMLRDHGSTNECNSGWNANRLGRFYFYRFTGKPSSGPALNNALCAVDTYTKLVYAYAIPDEFYTYLINQVPGGWWSVEDKVKEYKGEDYKFYEYNPIGWVNSGGTVTLFQAFKTIQSGAANKGKAINYLPKSEAIAGATVQMDINQMNANTPIRSPYYER